MSTVRLPQSELEAALAARPKHVFISGASRGIGEAVARLLGEEKAYRFSLAARSYNRTLGVAMDIGTDRAQALRMDLDDRIGLLGVNGAGKSTFAKLIAGALGVETGEFHRDKKMKVGWFHQHQIEAMDPEDTPLEIIRRAMPDASESSRRSKLAQFGLGFEKQETTVANLSGGERARQLLAVGASPAASDIPEAELAAYASVANVILNLDEVITK